MFAAPSHLVTCFNARPSAPSEPWYATVLLKGSDGERLEGAAMGLSSQAIGYQGNWRTVLQGEEMSTDFFLG